MRVRADALLTLAIAASAAAVPPAPVDAVGAMDRRVTWRQQRNRLIETDRTLEYDPTSILARFSGDAQPEAVAFALDFAGCEVIEELDTSSGGLLHVTAPISVQHTIAQLELVGGALNILEYAEPDYLLRAAAIPNDNSFVALWGMHNTGQTVNSDAGTLGADIDAPEAWDVFTGDASFAVAVIDTGIRKTHTDLFANIWTNVAEIAGDGIDNDANGYVDDTWGWNFYSNNNDPSDNNGHGSHCAGTIGAMGNNSRGVTGVVWRCKLVALKFLGGGGRGPTSGAIAALDYCRAHGIRLSNHSWTGPESKSLFRAIRNARNAGHLLVCAAGNEATDNDIVPSFPTSYTINNIVSVAAIDNDGNFWGTSNFGPASVDLAAPGVNIYSTLGSTDAALGFKNGTSMATAYVTGVAALVWSREPTLTFLQVRDRILSTVKPMPSLKGRCVTGGCVNAYNAIR